MVRAQLRRLAGGDHGWADDLAQETFLKAWRSLHQFRGEARFSTWLHRIAYSIFLQQVRTRNNQSSRPAGLGIETPGALAAPEGHELNIDVLAALDRLPPEERLSLIHCYHLDLSHEEAAFVLGIPVGTVKTHIARGKIKLRELLAAWGRTGGSAHD